MAHQDLDDLWLPSEFLTDDDLLTDFKTDRLGSKGRDGLWNGLGNSSGFSLDLSSPVLSAAGMTETESDEDDFIFELTRRVARSTLRDSENTTETWKLPGSPQSTLSGYKPVPNGDSNLVSRVCSPQDAKDVHRWDLLSAAAEEAARMRMIEETAAFYSTKLFGRPPKPTPVPNFYRNHHQTPADHTYNQLQAACFQQMKKLQLIKNGRVLGQGIMEYKNGRRTQDLSTLAWPTLQQHSQLQYHQPGSGMTAVFLGETGKKKERIGTGVFMPRRFGSNSTEPRKKSAGCSTVLLPDKVVHALNLNLDPIDTRVRVQPRQPDSASALKQRNTVMTRTRAVVNQELGLPQEWTY